MLKVATDCSGIGSPEQALHNLQIPHEIVFACEKDKYARQTYLANFKPNQMFEDMTSRDNSDTSLYADLYLAGIPCQSFSLAGKRLGELDPRGLLFYNFYDYVKQQKPKYFIIENVKGLLSDNNGKTFNTWLELLAETVNYQYLGFPHEDSLLYNVHHTVLNTKDFDIPQNRERVFIVGIRGDLPNKFNFPKGAPLTKKLIDVLESEVDEKYYLSEKMMNYLFNRKNNFNGGKLNLKTGEDIASTITRSSSSLDISDNLIVQSKSNRKTNIHLTDGQGISSCITQNYHKGVHNMGETYIISYTRDKKGKVIDRHLKDIANTIHTSTGNGGNTDQYVLKTEPFCAALRGRNPDNKNDRSKGAPMKQTLEPNSQGITNTLTSVQKDNLIVEPYIIQRSEYRLTGKLKEKNIVPCLKSETKKGDSESNVVMGNRIRRLTPLECFRLQGFPDSYNKPVSDTQLYRQAGNSITVSVIQAILNNLLK